MRSSRPGFQPAEDPAAAEAADPQFTAALWAFIAASKAGTARRSRRDSEFASCLAGMWEEAMAKAYAAIEGISIDQARAKVGELVEAQRAIYGSLAAGDL